VSECARARGHVPWLMLECLCEHECLGVLVFVDVSVSMSV